MRLSRIRAISLAAILCFLIGAPANLPLINTHTTTVLAATQNGPITKAELLAQLQAAARREVTQGDIAGALQERGIAFELSEALLAELRRAGAKTIVIDAVLRANTRRTDLATSGAPNQPPPANTNPADNQTSNATTNPEEEDARAVAKLPPIEQARYYALNYTQDLPNFIVHQRVRRFTRDPISGQWKPRDVLDLEVTYETSHGEQYRLQAINGQPTHEKYEEVGGASSAGEFGTVLVALFARKSNAQFKRGPSDKIEGRAAVIYDFRVPTATSSNQITETRTNQTITSGYKGSIWIDEETKRVLRVEQSADDIPAGFPITVAESAVDYSWVEISGKRYLLPKRAEVIIGSDREQLYSRNVLEFSDYRKFEVDIKIGGADDDDK